MAIKPLCDKCCNELTDYGAILLSPPNNSSEVKKFHICLNCYKDIEAELTNKD